VTLGQKQREFAENVGRLIGWCYASGYEITFGEAYRTPEQALRNVQTGVGIANSLHTKRLAVDLMLFIDGVWQTDSAAYAPLGKYWKSLHPDNAWGGDFSKPDGNHFSRSHEGVK
jgi:hypothetical protein